MAAKVSNTLNQKKSNSLFLAEVISMTYISQMPIIPARKNPFKPLKMANTQKLVQTAHKAEAIQPPILTMDTDYSRPI